MNRLAIVTLQTHRGRYGADATVGIDFKSSRTILFPPSHLPSQRVKEKSKSALMVFIGGFTEQGGLKGAQLSSNLPFVTSQMVNCQNLLPYKKRKLAKSVETVLTMCFGMVVFTQAS